VPLGDDSGEPCDDESIVRVTAPADHRWQPTGSMPPAAPRDEAPPRGTSLPPMPLVDGDHRARERIGFVVEDVP
jgi:hypothetical protein